MGGKVARFPIALPTMRSGANLQAYAEALAHGVIHITRRCDAGEIGWNKPTQPFLAARGSGYDVNQRRCRVLTAQARGGEQ